MPNWNKVLKEIQNKQREGIGALDHVRRRYLRSLYRHTGRNTIAYYSGWLKNPSRHHDLYSITDNDKNGFMNAVHGLDRTKGLDVIIHTPGGTVAATESLVDYLHKMFDGDIRAIIPQLAMSAGTMMACACKTIVMGKQSSIGPIDPQFGAISAKGVKEEFQRAIKETKEDPGKIPIWQAIISKYHPTFIAQCESACTWAESLVQGWLEKTMFAGQNDATKIAKEIAEKLANLGVDTSHGKHLSNTEAKNLGLLIEDLEDDQRFQDLVLTVHHAYMHTFAQSPCINIIENHLGQAMLHTSPPPNN